MTDTGALGHELTHSYFARGIMPANGNAGWIDEALASWRDNRYPRSTSISGTANMAGRPGYTRFTDYAAYSYGARFMAYLDGKFAAQGGLKTYLRKLVDEKAFTPYFFKFLISSNNSVMGGTKSASAAPMLIQTSYISVSMSP